MICNDHDFRRTVRRRSLLASVTQDAMNQGRLPTADRARIEADVAQMDTEITAYTQAVIEQWAATR